MAPFAVLMCLRPSTGISAVSLTNAVSYVFADQSPETMTHKYDWSCILYVSIHCSISKVGCPTVPTSSFREDERDSSRSHAYSAIGFFKVTSRLSVTHASYPNVRMRAAGNSCGRRALGQGSVASLAVHVASRSPCRPWVNTMLEEKYQVMLLS